MTDDARPASGSPAGIPPGYPYRPDDEVAPREVARLAPDAVVLVDVRTQAEAEICRLPNSRLFPLQSLEARIDELKAEVDDDLDRPRVVYCHHGRRSLTATFMLRAAGFRNVRSLAGGIHLWAADVDRSMPTY
ncbi:MAG: rhodanese-like domain-containing protein [bacterium]